MLGGASFYWNDRYLRDEFGGNRSIVR
ncbi:hypothetical protein ACO1DC_16115 [Bacillus velezensis]